VVLVDTPAGGQVRARLMHSTLERGDVVTVSYAGPPTPAYARALATR
jgi:hypothetical protein